MRSACTWTLLDTVSYTLLCFSCGFWSWPGRGPQWRSFSASSSLQSVLWETSLLCLLLLSTSLLWLECSFSLKTTLKKSFFLILFQGTVTLLLCRECWSPHVVNLHHWGTRPCAGLWNVLVDGLTLISICLDGNSLNVHAKPEKLRSSRDTIST